MASITVEVPEHLARRLQPFSTWLATVLELSLAGFKTPVAQTVAEVIDFLSNGPSSAEVADYTVSERANERVRRLLALNEAGLLSPEERSELDEVEKLEHILIMLKAEARERIKKGSNSA